MRIRCPHCHAEHCPEELPECRARGAERRLLYARANGSELEALRAENEVLRTRYANATVQIRKLLRERAGAAR